MSPSSIHWYLWKLETLWNMKYSRSSKCSHPEKSSTLLGWPSALGCHDAFPFLLNIVLNSQSRERERVSKRRFWAHKFWLSKRERESGGWQRPEMSPHYRLFLSHNARQTPEGIDFLSLETFLHQKAGSFLNQGSYQCLATIFVQGSDQYLQVVKTSKSHFFIFSMRRGCRYTYYIEYVFREMWR